jgi:hypothetical protein
LAANSNIIAPPTVSGLAPLPGMRFMLAPLYIQPTNKIKFAFAFSTEIAGHAVGEPSPLDLTNFSRNKARLLVEFEF